MICVTKQLFKFISPIAGTKYMDLFSGHFLCTKPCLKQSAGLCACKIRLEKAVAVIIAEGLLRQKHLTACLLRHFTKKLCVFYECFFIQNIAGCFYVSEFRRNASAGCCKWCSFIQLFHQSTSFGSWLSLRGRPYWSRASRNGSGSNSSTVYTPGLIHFPVSIISAPHIAGTPVV